mgnify:CR=1 FL=1
MEIKNKVIVITGGAGGIGLAIAKSLLMEDPKIVILADISFDDFDFNNNKVINKKCNVTKQLDLNNLINEVNKEFGLIDIFFSNAGILSLGDEQSSNEDWDKNWNLHVMSHVFAAQKLIRDKVTSDFDKKIDKGASTEFFKDKYRETGDLLKENLRSLGGDPFKVTPINNLEDYIKNKGEATAGNTNIFFNRLPYTLEQAEAYGVPDIFNTYAGGYAGVETPGSMEEGQEIDMGIKDVRDAYSSLPINMASQLAALEKKEYEEGMLKRTLENQLFADGGIAGLSGGDKSGPPPTSGPQPQGLLSLKNRVKNL